MSLYLRITYLSIFTRPTKYYSCKSNNSTRNFMIITIFIDMCTLNTCNVVTLLTTIRILFLTFESYI